MTNKTTFETIATKNLQDVTGGCGKCAGGNCGSKGKKGPAQEAPQGG